MLKKNSLNKIYTFLICSIIFLIPSNLFFKFYSSSAYVSGLLVDYLIPKIYLSDVFIIALLSLWSIEAIVVKKKKSKTKTAKLYFPNILISILIIRQILTPYPLAAIWYLFKIIGIGLLAWFLATHKKLLQKSTIYLAIIFTTLFQSGLALWQLLTQKSLLGFNFFGEPNLSNSIGLAKDMWWSTGRVLPYATTAHPNILGGILAIFSLILINWFLVLQKTQKKWTQILIIATVLLAIFVIILTQSISALTSLVIGSLIILLEPHCLKIANISNKLLIGAGAIIIITPLLINFTSISFKTDSLTRRSYLQTATINMFLDNPILGVGLNQFTARVEEYSNTQEVIRFVQPVHHVGLLWLAETGVLGILFILLWRKKLNIKKIVIPLLILLPLATLDHYLLTQESGLLLLIFTFNFFSQKLR